MRNLTGLLPVVGLMLAAPAGSQGMVRPIEFFEGTTVSEGTLKVAMKGAVRTRSVNRGTIDGNGTLALVQQVQDEGQPRTERRWRIQQTGPGKYTGTMSDASGPVTVERVGDRYRFRFRMSGGLAVEQWLAPHADGRTASSSITVRKFGLTVATSQSTIRKVTGA
jgi:hypothetical protein